MNRNKRHGISLFANKNLEENLFLIKSNLSSTKTFLKAYSDYPSSNVTTIQYEDNNKTTFYDTQRRQQPERKRRKTFTLRKRMQLVNQNMIDNVFKVEEKKQSRNTFNRFINRELTSTKYSERSTPIFNEMSQKVSFMKNTINFIFPRIYDLKQKERMREINEKNIEMNKKFRSRKQIYNLNLKDYIDFSPCINISKYNLKAFFFGQEIADKAGINAARNN